MPKTEWLRAGVVGRPDKVDREGNALRGYVVAQEGPFKSEGRGEFDAHALDLVEKLGNAARKGLKARLGHPTLSDDGIGKFLGRSVDFRKATALDARTGKKVRAVRADLIFDPSAASTPSGNLSDYVLSLAESDPDALSSSLVLETDQEVRLEKDGTPAADEDGNPLPPLWRPTRLHASDIVDTGDAVDGLLSPEAIAEALSTCNLPAELLRFDRVQRLGAAALDTLFRDLGRADVEEKVRAWLARYLEQRFGAPEPTPPAAPRPRLDSRRGRLEELRLTAAKLLS